MVMIFVRLIVELFVARNTLDVIETAVYRRLLAVQIYLTLQTLCIVCINTRSHSFL